MHIHQKRKSRQNQFVTYFNKITKPDKGMHNLLFNCSYLVDVPRYSVYIVEVRLKFL